MLIWTENPINEMWKQLKFISYKENCRNLLIGKIKSGRTLIYSTTDTILERKIDEISMCIQQGIEYFDAANRITINTSPLLVYYGMLSLAKALVVANSKDTFIDDIKYHGLSTRPVNAELEAFRSDKTNWCIENEFAVVNSGVFNSLNTLINPSRVLHKDSIINIKNSISCVPEMKALFEKFYNEHSNSFDMYTELKEFETGKLEFAIGNEENPEKLFKCIPKITNDFEQTENMHNLFPHFRSKENMKIEQIDYIENYSSFVGGRYIISGLKYEINGQENKMIIDQVLIDYMVLFILGEQVRYHQDLWGKLVRGENSGTIGLLEIYIDIVKRRFPNEILNRLFEEDFDYGTPARFS